MVEYTKKLNFHLIGFLSCAFQCFLSCAFQCFSWNGKGANGWSLTRRGRKHIGLGLRVRNGMFWSKRNVIRREFTVEVQSTKGALVVFSGERLEGTLLLVQR